MGLSRNIYEEEEVAKVADPVVEKFGLCELKPKMSWPTVEACREFFVTMAIKHRFSFRQVRNDKFRVFLRRELSMELVEGDVVPNVYFMIKKRELRHHWYCSPYFNVEAFRRTYANYLFPLENIEDWEEIDDPQELVLPPEVANKVGRPRKQRISGDDEPPKTRRKCTKYGEPGQSVAFVSHGSGLLGFHFEI
ncbi:hypothetical protein IFM89_011279 [Coptis chinensis]|uniref:Uncharacterized protein n=1 Tax=Coptis chinensis TaxID=261450 RepID=A0A835H9Y8_9MAGN|nr:hypothetical protein IFM89_011279 [Coptis chinensis]